MHMKLFYEQDEPDGSDCHFCGETIYLILWRAFTSSDFDPHRPTDLVLCDGCHTIVTADLPAPD